MVLKKLEERLHECGLELHPLKTGIIYCADENRRQSYPVIQFTFLGYTYRPRRSKDKYGRIYVNFLPAVSRDALMAMRQKVRRWHLQLKCDKDLGDLSNMFKQILRGWSQYYGQFYSSAMKSLWRSINGYLIRWLRRKYKGLKIGVIRASKALGKLADKTPHAFVHGQLGYFPGT